MGSTQSTGVARSLELLNQTATTTEVAKNELGVQDRLLGPMLERTARPRLRAVARRAPAAGSTRSLDQAGNPAGWTVERIMGAKGARPAHRRGPRRLLLVGFSVKGLLFAAAAGAAGFFLPDLLLYNAGTKRQAGAAARASPTPSTCSPSASRPARASTPRILQVARTVTGPIAGEFARVLSEIQIGKSRGRGVRLAGRAHHRCPR